MSVRYRYLALKPEKEALMAEAPRQTPTVTVQTAVMTNFCFPFADVLLQKLKELQKEDGIFAPGEDVAKQSTDASPPLLTAIGEAVIANLYHQVFTTYYREGERCSYDKVIILMEAAEELLNIFRP